VAENVVAGEWKGSAGGEGRAARREGRSG